MSGRVTLSMRWNLQKRHFFSTSLIRLDITLISLICECEKKIEQISRCRIKKTKTKKGRAHCGLPFLLDQWFILCSKLQFHNLSNYSIYVCRLNDHLVFEFYFPRSRVYYPFCCEIVLIT